MWEWDKEVKLYTSFTIRQVLINLHKVSAQVNIDI